MQMLYTTIIISALTCGGASSRVFNKSDGAKTVVIPKNKILGRTICGPVYDNELWDVREKRRRKNKEIREIGRSTEDYNNFGKA